MSLRPVAAPGVTTRTRAQVLAREHTDLLRASCALAALVTPPVPAAAAEPPQPGSGGGQTP